MCLFLRLLMSKSASSYVCVCVAVYVCVSFLLQVWWVYDKRFHEATVLDYNADLFSHDTRGNIGPTHSLCYETGTFPENLATCVWEMDSSQDSPLQQVRAH